MCAGTVKAMSRIIALLHIIVTVFSLTSSQQNQFLGLLRELRLPTDNHFNAALGAKVQVLPNALSDCKPGNHCISPWWLAESNVLPEQVRD